MARSPSIDIARFPVIPDVPVIFQGVPTTDGVADAPSSSFSTLSTGGAFTTINNVVGGDGSLRSSNFVTGTTGWRIRGNGDVEFNSGTFRGALIAGEIHIPDRSITTRSFHVNTSGTMWIGATEADFALNNNNAEFYVLNTGAMRVGTTAASFDWNVTTTDALTIRGNNAAGPIITTINEATSGIHMEQYSANSSGPNVTFRKSRGTFAAPTAALLNDTLGFVGANGYGATGFPAFGTFQAAITFSAAENWTDAARGTYIDFSTTTAGGTARLLRMRLEANGDITLSDGTDITLSGESARTVTMARFSIAGAGNNLTIGSGGAGSGTVNGNGGTLLLQSGIATGSGSSSIELYTATPGVAGAADNTPSVKMSILGNGNTTFTQAVVLTGSPTAFTITGGAHTTLTASTEATDINLNLARTVQFATGALATQRAVRVQAPTYAFVGASTLTTAITFSITGAPIAGTNATLTTSIAANIEQFGGSSETINGIRVNQPGIANGFGAVTTIAGLDLPTASIVLGNQTATATDVFGIRLGIQTYTSTTLVRTVTNLATFYVEGAPVASTNVTATNGPYAVFIDGGVSRFDGNLLVGATVSPAGMTGPGVAINQAGSDNEILTLKSSDVAHGVTTLTETDTFGFFQKASATNGGLSISGIGSSTTAGLNVIGIHVTADTTKANGSTGAVQVIGQLRSGTTTGSLGANANIIVFRDDGTVRFILDSDGDSHQDVGTAWTNFDEQNDVELLTQLSVQVSRQHDPIRLHFAEFLDRNRRRLEELKLVTFNENGHPFVNWSKLNMLLVGAVRQLYGRIQRVEEAQTNALLPQ
ncbi:MAG: hypothetical protein QME66_05505 [Candidatus Eisenbacteria bacterium]|nr:hypothetical protein [Candidatus Eisenbacteria bacterium]